MYSAVKNHLVEFRAEAEAAQYWWCIRLWGNFSINDAWLLNFLSIKMKSIARMSRVKGLSNAMTNHLWKSWHLESGTEWTEPTAPITSRAFCTLRCHHHCKNVICHQPGEFMAQCRATRWSERLGFSRRTAVSLQGEDISIRKVSLHITLWKESVRHHVFSTNYFISCSEHSLQRLRWWLLPNSHGHNDFGFYRPPVV